MENTTRKHLKMHTKLLLDVIKRQAGTLQKTLLEGIMNAVEAGATKVQIFYSDDRSHLPPKLSIVDNGKGIQSVADIERFFETFGTPHDESEGKIWAQFRMGRGQLFSFGKNVWRTSTFAMTVDINNLGLEYDLSQNLPSVEGCRIDISLYERPFPLSFPSLNVLISAVAEQIEFLKVPVFFNGKQLNKAPEGLKWTYEDDDAFYLFGVGNALKIYNIGAFVTNVPSYNCGVEGIIVSKKQLRVNFARNEVQSDCEVYRRIKKVIAANRRDKTKQRRRTLTRSDKIALLIDLRDGGISYDDVKTCGLLTTATGRSIKLADVLNSRLPWTFAPENDRRADKIMQHDQGVCLHRGILTDVGYDGKPKDFFSWLLQNAYQHDYDRVRQLRKWKALAPMYREFEELAKGIKNSYKIIPHKEMNTAEKALLRILDGHPKYWEGRRLIMGLSECADAWTDGSSYVALNRSMLERVGTGPSGIAYVINVLTHEMAHDEDTTGTHVHGEDFYRKFHDICLQKNPPQCIIADVYDRMTKNKRLIVVRKASGNQ